MTERKPVDGGLGLEQAKNRDRVALESSVKFRFFFTGLVFAILSFAIQFPINSPDLRMKTLEASAWLFIAFTALLSLIDLGGFSTDEDHSVRLTRRWQGVMWFLFFLGVALLLTAKIAASLVAPNT